jgi:hypothetical protein
LITLKYSAALCGAGKTRWACGHTAQNLGRYLYAVDRRNVLSATKDLIETFARIAGTNPTIIELYSASDGRKGGVSDVRRKVREAGCQYATHQHVVVLVTHEALKSSDLSTYVSGWTCIIDEIPKIISHAEATMPVLPLLLKTICNLKPIDNTGWSELRLKADAPLLTDVSRDTFLSGFSELYRKIRDNNTLLKISAWEDALEQAACSFFTLWSPEALAPFCEVYVLGNACEHSITYKLVERNFQREVKLQPFSIPAANRTPPRSTQLLIRYFASCHEAGSTFWQSEAGQECLRRIPWWVNANSEPKNHYWSCNISTYQKREEMVGKWVSPKIAGENGLRHLTCGTFIYSAKPSDAEIETLKIFNILLIPGEAAH